LTAKGTIKTLFRKVKPPKKGTVERYIYDLRNGDEELDSRYV